MHAEKGLKVVIWFNVLSQLLYLLYDFANDWRERERERNKKERKKETKKQTIKAKKQSIRSALFQSNTQNKLNNF